MNKTVKMNETAEIAEGPEALAKLILGMIAIHGFVAIVITNRGNKELLLSKTVHNTEEFVTLMKDELSKITEEHGPFESVIYDDEKGIISLGYLEKGSVADLLGATLH